MVADNVQPGSTVRFQLSSAVCPLTEQVREKITSTLEVTGKIAFLSDAGARKSHFAVVDVDGIMSPLIVPIELLQYSRQSSAARDTVEWEG